MLGGWTTMDGSTWGSALAKFIVICFFGAYIATMVLVGVYFVGRWNYRKCHDWWYPEEAEQRKIAEVIAAMAPELRGGKC